jgi:hypothetical protein
MIVQIQLLSYMKLIGLHSMAVLFLISTHANAQIKLQNQEVTYRRVAFKADVCTKIDERFSANNLYFVKSIAGTIDKSQRNKIKTHAVKFSTGLTYRVIISVEKNNRREFFLIERKKKTTKLNCTTQDKSVSIGAKHPINSLGHYLDIVNVSDAGAYGADVTIEVCRIGAHCDYGVQGFVLKNNKDQEIWARMIAIKDFERTGHPTYHLPKLYAIREGIFDSAFMLEDDSILLVYDNTAAIRISSKNGFLIGTSQDASSVDMNDWAALKSIYSKRFLKFNSNCLEKKTCSASVSEGMYFYSLQSFLFPKNIQEK